MSKYCQLYYPFAKRTSYLYSSILATVYSRLKLPSYYLNNKTTISKRRATIKMLFLIFYAMLASLQYAKSITLQKWTLCNKLTTSYCFIFFDELVSWPIAAEIENISLVQTSTLISLICQATINYCLNFYAFFDLMSKVLNKLKRAPFK